MLSCFPGGSRFAPLNKSRVEDNVSDVVASEDPSQESLQAKAVASVGTRAILTLHGWCVCVCMDKGTR